MNPKVHNSKNDPTQHQLLLEIGAEGGSISLNRIIDQVLENPKYTNNNILIKAVGSVENVKPIELWKLIPKPIVYFLTHYK